jgi:hypothetical protein
MLRSYANKAQSVSAEAIDTSGNQLIFFLSVEFLDVSGRVRNNLY